jgi:hypothetical protein
MRTSQQSITEQKYRPIFQRAPELQQHKIHQEPTQPNQLALVSVLSTKLTPRVKQLMVQAFLPRQIK